MSPNKFTEKKQEKPILYSYFRSSASYRVRIALHLKNIEFDYQAVHLLKDGGQQNTMNFKAVNPMGQVPAFVDGMNVVAQSMAIIEYIDEKWPEPKLFPKKIEDKALIVELCEIVNSGIQPLVNLKVRNMLSQEFKATEEQVKKWCQSYMQQGLEAIEKKIAKTAGTYSIGEKVSAVDTFLVPAVYGAQGQGVDISKYPTIKKVNDYLVTQEAFKKSHPSNQPDTPMEN